MNTAQKIDQLYEYKIQRDVISLDKSKELQKINDEKMQKLKDAVPPEVKAMIEKIEKEAEQLAIDFEAEFGDKLIVVDQKIDALDAEVRDEVLKAKATVHSASGEYMAVFRNGSTTWDTKGLQGYAKAHPEVLDFEKTGKPSVAIQVAK